MSEENIPALEESCKKCEGKGWVYEEGCVSGYQRGCNKCDGAGNVPSQFGINLLHFLRKNLELKIK